MRLGQGVHDCCPRGHIVVVAAIDNDIGGHGCCIGDGSTQSGGLKIITTSLITLFIRNSLIKRVNNYVGETKPLNLLYKKFHKKRNKKKVKKAYLKKKNLVLSMTEMLENALVILTLQKGLL